MRHDSGTGMPGSEDEPGIPAFDGMIRASELTGGRRRRRSALAAEAAEAAGASGPEQARAGGGPDWMAPPTADEPSGEPELTKEERKAARKARKEQRAAEEADPAERARAICLRLLTGAAKTRKQLAEALAKREIPAEVAEQVLDRLEEVGLIDDGAFAEAWVESRHHARGLGRRVLAQELRQRGVAPELAERALAQVDEDDEQAAAREFVERRLRTMRGLDDQAKLRRLVGALARRGYPEGLAFRIVKDALEAER
ncbi:regulatory protein RecX [Kitasatospora sp. NPDC096147]|uniref:regulatory protein RecX n=1 Tax=Kitasatospora sp. NPDC096147 TaxID=3364093 RepID=UPI0037F3419C